MRFANLTIVHFVVSVVIQVFVGLPTAAHAQSALPVGAGAATGGGAGVAGGGSMANPANPFVPGGGGAVTLTPTQAAASVIPNFTGGGNSALSALGQACTLAGNALMTGSQTELLNTQRFGKNLADEAYKNLENKWSLPEGESRAGWGALAGAYNKNLSGNCQQKFIDKNGNLGQWGATILSYIQNHPDPYLQRTPSDIHSYCPKFSTFSEGAKNRFWTYLLMVMAQPESSCNPTAVGRGPNGAAIGLFQLEKKACDRVGVYGTPQDLLNGRHNIQCAVSLLASELRERPTITSPTSKGRTGTYWAPLRSDIEARLRSSNVMARNDTKASRSFQHMIRQYSECHNGEDASKNTGAASK